MSTGYVLNSTGKDLYKHLGKRRRPVSPDGWRLTMVFSFIFSYELSLRAGSLFPGATGKDGRPSGSERRRVLGTWKEKTVHPTYCPFRGTFILHLSSQPPVVFTTGEDVYDIEDLLEGFEEVAM